MKDIIELLQKERIKTVDALKHGNQQELSYLQQIDKALGWLKRIEEKGLEDKIQKETDKYVAKIDEIADKKEKEIMSV